MKLPFLPVHVLLTKNLIAKIESTRSQVQNGFKENRQKDNRAIARLLHRNHQLISKIVEQNKIIKEFREKRR